MSIPVQILMGAMWIAGYLAAPILLIWGWTRWAVEPEPRTVVSILSLIGFSLSTASALLAISAVTYALLTHGFRYYDPRLLQIFRWGLLLSLSGAIFGLGGTLRKNSLRWHAPLSALAMLAFWFAAAIGE